MESSRWLSIGDYVNNIPLGNLTFLFLSVEVSTMFLMFLTTSQINKFNKNDLPRQRE